MSKWHEVEGVRLTERLKQVYGDAIELTGERGESDVHRLIVEFAYGEREYAVLQTEAMRKEHEVALFAIGLSADGEPELLTIEDDDEWETVSELYDEMSFPLSDRP